jgi:hypothetical protein
MSASHRARSCSAVTASLLSRSTLGWKDARRTGIEICDATRHLHDDLLPAAETE